MIAAGARVAGACFVCCAPVVPRILRPVPQDTPRRVGDGGRSGRASRYIKKTCTLAQFRNGGCLCQGCRGAAQDRDRYSSTESAMLRTQRRGFTLIELLIVVVLIGILAA